MDSNRPIKISMIRLERYHRPYLCLPQSSLVALLGICTIAKADADEHASPSLLTRLCGSIIGFSVAFICLEARGSSSDGGRGIPKANPTCR